jgi:uncharacterized protein (DUF2141 family)
VRPAPLLKLTALFLLSTLLAGANVWAESSKLVVNLEGIKDATGNLRATLYRESDAFRKEDKAFKLVSLPASKGTVKLVFAELPPGRYAVMAYHDEDSDQKLKLRFGMFPLEGYGLSNNPKVSGPPKFADSAFEVAGAETSINIKLNY